MPDDHPKFSDFYNWALQYAPTRKKPKKTPTTPPPPPPRSSYIRRAIDRNRNDIRSYVVQVLAGLSVIGFALLLGLSHLESTPSDAAAQPAHPWNEDMTVTPTEQK